MEQVRNPIFAVFAGLANSFPSKILSVSQSSCSYASLLWSTFLGSAFRSFYLVPIFIPRESKVTTRTRSNKQATLSEIRRNVSASISYGRTIVGANLTQTYKARHTCNEETEFEGSKGGKVRGNVRSDARRRKRFAFESRVEEIARAKKTGRVYERFATIKAAASETIFQIRPRHSQGRPDVCPNTRESPL